MFTHRPPRNRLRDAQVHAPARGQGSGRRGKERQGRGHQPDHHRAGERRGHAGGVAGRPQELAGEDALGDAGVHLDAGHGPADRGLEHVDQPGDGLSQEHDLVLEHGGVDERLLLVEELILGREEQARFVGGERTVARRRERRRLVRDEHGQLLVRLGAVGTHRER